VLSLTGRSIGSGNGARPCCAASQGNVWFGCWAPAGLPRIRRRRECQHYLMWTTLVSLADGHVEGPQAVSWPCPNEIPRWNGWVWATTGSFIWWALPVHGRGGGLVARVARYQ
jgi:hypothetical protein